MSEFIHNLLGYIGLALPALVIITNPLAAASFFVSMSEGQSDSGLKKIAWKASLTSMWVMIIFAVFGTLIFKLFSITIYAFQIAGGIILFGVGMDIRKGRRNEGESKKIGEDFSIVPLAIPIISGPGAITTTLMLAGDAENIAYLIALIVCIVISLAVMYLVLTNAHKLTNLLGEGGVKILSRLMGLILAVMAVQFVLNGIKGAIPTLAPVLSNCIKG